MRPTARHRITLTLVAAALVAGACGSGDDDVAEVDPQPATEAPQESDLSPIYQAYRAAPTACGAEQPAPLAPMSFETHADQSLDPNAPIKVVIETSCGDIEVELDPAGAPLTVNSFVFLAREGFFNGTVSHRVMPGFMFQAGDPTATGVGDAGYDIAEDEFPAAGFRYERGVVAMANAGPGTTGSQFFIMFGSSALPPNYTVIGRVTSGDEVLDAIASIPIAASSSGERSVPLEALYLERVVVVEGP